MRLRTTLLGGVSHIAILYFWNNIRKELKMSKTNSTSIVPSIIFSENTVFVRRASEYERNAHFPGNIKPFHSVIDVSGELLAIVCGPPEYAFNAAREKNANPVWMQ